MTGAPGAAVELADQAGAVRLRVRAKPGGRADRLIGAHAGALKVEVTAPPERGKANAAIVRLLARTLGLPRRQVLITAGETAQDKTVTVVGCSALEVAAALERAGVATLRT